MGRKNVMLVTIGGRHKVGFVMAMLAFSASVKSHTANEAEQEVYGPRSQTNPPKHQHELVVTAARIDRDHHTTPLPISVVDRVEIERRQARGVEDLLRGIPGVTSSGGPRSEAVDPNVRGLGNGRVVIRLDGARQNLNITHRGQTFLDPLLIERVEVLRGPASTLYGSGAIGGVVNFHTLDADGFLDSGANVGAALSGGYQDNSEQTYAALSLAARADSFGLLGSFNLRSADDFEDGSGEAIPYSEVDAQSGLLKGTWRPNSAQRWTLSYLDFSDNSLSLSTADRDTGDPVDRETQQRTTTLRFEHRPDNSRSWNLDMSFYATEAVLDEFQIEGPGHQSNQLATVGIDLFNSSELAIQSVLHQFAYGLEVYRDSQEGWQDDEPRLGFANSQQDTIGVFVQDHIGVTERLGLTLGARFDRIEQTAEREGLEDSVHSEWSTLLAVDYRWLEHFHWSAGYSEAFRAPSLRELFVGGQHFPGNNYVPNPDLQPESAQNLEAGMNYTRPNALSENDQLRIKFNLFRNEIEDFIEQVVSREPQNITAFRNVDKARITGAELELRYELPGWYGLLIGTHLRGDDLGEDLPLQSIPAHEIMFESAGLWLRRTVETGVRATFTMEQDRVRPGPHSAPATDSHNVIDLFARWQPTDHFTLNLGVDNLGNETYRRHLTRINDRGRTAKVGFSYRFF